MTDVTEKTENANAEQANAEQAKNTKAKAPKKPKRVLEKKNGMTRPGPGTLTGQVWQIADDLTAKIGSPARRRDVLQECAEKGIKETTAATQYGRWRKFNGLEGRGDDDDKLEEPTAKTVDA